MTMQYHTEISSLNHSGPRGVAVTGITFHHWGDDGLFNDSETDSEVVGIAKYLSRSGGITSAHYVVSGDDVYCIVADSNYAWHAGNTTGNKYTIGVEVDPDAEKQPTTYKTLAELVRLLESRHGRMAFYRHSDWKATACPGDLDTGRIRRMADETTPAPTTTTTEGFLMALTDEEQNALRINVEQIETVVRRLEAAEAERRTLDLAHMGASSQRETDTLAKVNALADQVAALTVLVTELKNGS